jgi:hypothetical protein
MGHTQNKASQGIITYIFFLQRALSTVVCIRDTRCPTNNASALMKRNDKVNIFDCMIDRDMHITTL